MLTIKQFELIYDRYQSSGLPVKEFCQNEGIVTSKFFYWQRRLREQNLRMEQRPDFVPVVFTGVNPQPVARKVVKQNPATGHDAYDNGDFLEIVYPNGVKVRLPAGSDTNQLRSLILLTQ